MSNGLPSYAVARGQLVEYLRSQGYKTHPYEVFCPGGGHCWVDVAALKGQDYWAFEYKSRTDSIRRGFDQCCSYSKGFNYVVLVADRCRVTASPYFSRFRAQGFGMWRHDRSGFHTILEPKRRPARRDVNVVVQRQFKRVIHNYVDNPEISLSRWFSESETPQIRTSLLSGQVLQ
jgi:hypothetical protein